MHHHQLSTAERVARLTNRLHPLARPAHGFYEPAAFIATCRGNLRRDEFFRRACRRMAGWEARA